MRQEYSSASLMEKLWPGMDWSETEVRGKQTFNPEFTAMAAHLLIMSDQCLH